MKLIQSRNKDDCVICAVAMLLDISYEDSCKLFPRYFEPVQGVFVRGASDTEVNLALVKFGKALSRFVPATRDTRGVETILYRQIEDLMNGRPALIGTVGPTGRRHAVAWNGFWVYDPARATRWKLKNRYIVESVDLIVKLN